MLLAIRVKSYIAGRHACIIDFCAIAISVCVVLSKDRCHVGLQSIRPRLIIENVMVVYLQTCRIELRW